MLIEHQLVLMEELAKPGYATDLASRDHEAVATSLNYRESVPNPVPQPERPRFLAWDVFIDLLEPVDILVLYTYNQLSTDLRRALEQNDRTVMLAIWRGLKSVMSASSVTAVEAAATDVELDPNWNANVLQPSIVQILGLPRITYKEVQEMHHKMGGG